MESKYERGTERILRLINSLRSLQKALAIEDPRARDEETLRNVMSLIKDVEDSYEWLVGTPRERAHELLEVLEPLSTHAKIYESISSTLRCIEKSSEMLGKISREDEAVYDLYRVYNEFKESIKSFADRSLARVRPYLKTAQLDLLTSSALNEILGDRLERYYVPKLVKRMGYQLKSRVVSTSIGDVQVDVRAEKDKIAGFENLERLRKKSILIVEAKATVESEDIKALWKKSKAILDNYSKEAEIWKYKIASETWMVACYGWDEGLKDYARHQNIIPIDGEELHLKLREYNLFDRGRPPCPKQPKQNPK